MYVKLQLKKPSIPKTWSNLEIFQIALPLPLFLRKALAMQHAKDIVVQNTEIDCCAKKTLALFLLPTGQ